MKRLLIILGALMIAVAIGISIARYPAVLIIGFGPWRIDMPFWIAALTLVIFYLALHILFEILHSILRVARSLAHFRSHYRKHRAKALMRKGLLALQEGEFATAEKALEQAAQSSDMPWFNYLSAAKAAQALDQTAKAQQYFQQTKALAPDAAFAIALLQARYDLKQKHYQEAISILEYWLDKKPHHPLLLKDLQYAYFEMKKWESLSILLSKLKRNHILSKEEFRQIEQEVWKNRIAENISVWKDIPSYLHSDPVIVLVYAKMLVKNSDFLGAENVLRQAIKQEWDEKLVQYYGCFQHPHPEKSLSVAESWIARHPESASLLSTLGRLCVQAQLWGKAQRYFEASLSIRSDPATCAELATLLEKINKLELSAQYYKKAALLTPNLENV